MKFKKGDKVKILPNLPEVMGELGFTLASIDLMSRLVGTKREIFFLWKDGYQEYATVDLCVEIPVQCCTLY